MFEGIFGSTRAAGVEAASAAEDEEIMQGRVGHGNYGTTDPEKKEYEWESRGSPLTLSISVAAVMGKQVVALALIIMQVSYSKEYLMDCDDRVVGLPTAFACEWTKTYVRCFPLIAVVVSLMAASRFLLHHRSFYELLRHGALLNFNNFPPYKDPLFLILVWCLLNACLHFIFSLWKAYRFNIYNIRTVVNKAQNAHFQQELNQAIVFYVVPSAIFMAFLFSSYDTEAQLVPLSKYIEEDPDALKRVVAKMNVMDENDVARVVERGLPFQKLPDSITSKDAYEELVVEWRKDQERKNAGEETPEDLADEHLGNWRLVNTQWPALILLDGRLSDERSANFRYAWYVFSVVSMAVIIFVDFTFVMQMLKEVEDVFVDGQKPDIASLIIQITFCGLASWLANAFCRNATIPCTSIQFPKTNN